MLAEAHEREMIWLLQSHLLLQLCSQSLGENVWTHGLKKPDSLLGSTGTTEWPSSAHRIKPISWLPNYKVGSLKILELEKTSRKSVMIVEPKQKFKTGNRLLFHFFKTLIIFQKLKSNLQHQRDFILDRYRWTYMEILIDTCIYMG